jgi:cytochrome c oxidase assembly protein subunit 15
VDRSIRKGLTLLSGTFDSDRQRATRRNVVWFAWAVLVYMLGVILWGAYVRASGSGAGCGNHWPLCNGEVIPTSPSTERLIEFTHRLTSGLALISVLALLYLTWRATTRQAWARVAAMLSVVFMLNEALLGALLVLLQHVGNDQSASRAVFLSMHFANTLLLIASITLTAVWLSHPPARSDFSGKKTIGTLIGLLAVILIGVSGALAALGDTLFPATSLSGSISSDFSAASHFLLRLRLLHPALAVIGAVYVIWLFARCVLSPSTVVRRLAVTLTLMVLLQLCLGALNVLLLAPIWLQMTHLLAADLFWILLVLVSDHALRMRREPLTNAIQFAQIFRRKGASRCYGRVRAVFKSPKGVYFSSPFRMRLSLFRFAVR